jgi:hypothetical protein
MNTTQHTKNDNLKKMSEKLAKDVIVIQDIMKHLNIPTLNNNNNNNNGKKD